MKRTLITWMNSVAIVLYLEANPIFHYKYFISILKVYGFSFYYLLQYFMPQTITHIYINLVQFQE